jgi:ParB family chromosome partitioning protein
MINSIRQHGLLQPLVVRPKEDIFEIVIGCRRFLACKSLNWKKITCHTVHLNEVQAYEVSLVENIRRKSLTPLEEATAFKKYVSDNGWGSVSKLASKIGKNPSYIIRRIALLNLPDDVLERIKNSSLSPSSAEELFLIKDREKQSHLARLIARRHLTIKKIRDTIKNDPYFCENSDIIEVRSELQSFNKSIVVLRIAMNRIVTIMEEDKENTLIYEQLLYQKNVLHNQIDLLLKSKKKYAKQIFRYRKIMNN